MAYSKIILNGETLMDVTSDTVDAGNLLSGKTATKNSGAKVTGNFPDSPVFTINWNGTTWDYTVTCNKTYSECLALYQDENYISRNRAIVEDYVDGSYNISMGGSAFLDGTTLVYTFCTGGLDALYEIRYNSNNTLEFSQNPSTLLHGEFSVPGYYSPGTYNAYKTVNINIPSKSSSNTTFTSSTGTFTAPSGYYSTNATRTITTQAAQTFYPSTADQTIASYRWLTGTQTIKSVTTSNLTAENIAEGVVVKVGDANNASRITQITGTHSGGGKHTCTIKGNGINGMAPVRVVYNNTNYYQNNSSFQFSAGETITCSCIYGDVNHIYVNGESVATTGYTYTLPDKDIEITMYYDVSQENEASIKIAVSIIPVNTYNITSNGTYNVYEYSAANVNVSGGEYYDAYKTIVEKPAFYYNSSFTDFIDYIGQISTISSFLFAGKQFMTGTWTFSNCQRISTNAFNGDGRTGWTVANVSFNFPIVSSIGSSAFFNQQQFQSINCPSCTVINASAFYSCSKLSTISFPACTLIGDYAFASCSALTTISFPACTSIGEYAFSKCTYLSAISFPVCTSIDNYAFANCSALTTASFPSCTFAGHYAFINCASLTTASFPVCTSIGNYTFSNCKKLSIISFPSCNFIGWSAFASCSALTTISFPACTSIDGYAFASCSALATANFPSCIYIKQYAFANCPALATISFPVCTSIGQYAFAGCSALTIASFSSCTLIGSSAFSCCSALTTVNFARCTSIGAYAFSSCVNLISLYLNNVSSVPTFGIGMFNSTPISNYSTVAGRYGSIFVPSSLYAEFTTATSWKSYSARMVSV